MLYIFFTFIQSVTHSYIKQTLTTDSQNVDKVRMYEEIMTNDDNLESYLLTQGRIQGGPGGPGPP